MQLETRNLSEQLIEVVRERILSGAFAENRPIRQDTLAAELKISKIPLREALARLEQEGLVISEPNRGYIVRGMSRPEAEEVYSLRLRIEPDATAYACRLATDDEQALARKWLDKLDDVAAAHGTEVGRLNREFHMALIRPGRRYMTANLLHGLHVVADRYVQKHLEPVGRHQRAEAEHEEIFEAWNQRRSRDVKRLIKTHLGNTLDDLRTQLKDSD